MESKRFRLVPPAMDQARSFWSLTGPDEELWQYVNNGMDMPKSIADIERMFESWIARNGKDGDEIFVMQSKETGDYFGKTSFLDVIPEDRHMEIGGTFIAPAYRGGTTNFEIKLMMLTEAFDLRGCERVTLKANALNARSRRAIEKIGAKFEGILRHHRLMSDGSWRDSAYYSILREEWPQVRSGLEEKIEMDISGA